MNIKALDRGELVAIAGGILLGLSVMVITGITLVLADIFLAKGNGTAGVAALM